MSATLPLLLLPGLMCDAAVWRPQVQAFGQRTRCVVADYGMADSIEAMARAALQQADAAGCTGKLAVAGHSMGGRVAFDILRLAPERVARLALLDTGVHPLASGEAGERERSNRMALVRQSEAEGMRAMGGVWARGMVPAYRLADPVFEDILQMIERSTPAHFAAQQKALLGRRDATPQLSTIACPTLVLCGQEDAWSPVAQHETICAGIAGSNLVVVPQCGHMSTMERPAAVTAAMAAWLEIESA